MKLRIAPAFLALTFAVVTAAGVGLTTARATAVFQQLTETGAPGYLTLALDSATPLSAELGPGESMRWLVEASLHDAERGTLAIELQAGGDLVEASAMTAAVEACSGGFDITVTPVSCQGSLTTVLPTAPLAAISQQGDRYDLAELHRGAPRQLLVTIAIPADAPEGAVDGRAARIGLGVHAAGEDDPAGTVVSTDRQPAQSPRLAVTGADLAALGVLAVGLLGLGATALVRGRRRSHTETRGGGAR